MNRMAVINTLLTTGVFGKEKSHCREWQWDKLVGDLLLYESRRKSYGAFHIYIDNVSSCRKVIKSDLSLLSIDDFYLGSNKRPVMSNTSMLLMFLLVVSVIGALPTKGLGNI